MPLHARAGSGMATGLTVHWHDRPSLSPDDDQDWLLHPVRPEQAEPEV